MFRPVALFIALRYARTRRRQRFATFVSLVSMGGIGLAVAALIIVLSVMNGFEREVTRHVLGMSAHGILVPPTALMADWRPLLARADRHPGTVGVTPYLRGSGMVSSGGEVRGVVIEGIDPRRETRVSDIDDYIPAAALEALDERPGSVLVGSELARATGVTGGDRLTVMIPRWHADGHAAPPEYRGVVVNGMFHVGMHQYDSRLLLGSLATAQELLTAGDAVSGFRARFDDPRSAPAAVRQLAVALDADLRVLDWTQYHRNFFLALASQKRIMFVILALIVAVAAFNIAANMIMVVTEKTSDIAILVTMGMTRRRILGVFLLHGLAIGALGTLIGTVLGALGARFSTGFARLVESLFGLKLINADVYFIDYLPADLRAPDVVVVALTTLAFAVIATIYPALRAAAVRPAEALHRD